MPTVRSLADELRARDDEQLVALLLARPDLAVPPPADLAALAARAAGRSSVYRALAGLDRARLHVAGLIAEAGALADDEVARACAAPADAVGDIIDDLVRLALIWGPPRARRPVRVLSEVVAATAVDDRPAGLPEPPSPPGVLRDPAEVDSAAAGAVTEIVMLVDDLVRLVDDDPPSVLRHGGLSVRELTRLTRQLGIGADSAALALEVAGGAGLINTDRRGEVIRPTEAADEWRDVSLIERWFALVDGWLRRAGSASLVGTRDERGQLRAALSPATLRDGEIRLRRAVVAALAPSDPGAEHTVELVRQIVAFRAPRGPVASAAHALPAIWTQAHTLGVLSHNCLSAFGRVVASGADQMRVGTAESARLARLLPCEVDRVLAQSDLTAVAPGPLTRTAADFMHLVADVESRGTARVFRFSAASVQRGLQSGLNAAEVVARLRELCGDVPQPLSYLIGDLARRHGRLRVGAASTYLRDEPDRLAELLADPALSALRLTRLAPTVLVSPLSPASVLAGLGSAGLAPVVEGPATRPGSGPRAARPRQRPGGRPRTGQGTAAGGDRAVAAGPGPGAGCRGSRPVGVDQRVAGGRRLRSVRVGGDRRPGRATAVPPRPAAVCGARAGASARRDVWTAGRAVRAPHHRDTRPADRPAGQLSVPAVRRLSHLVRRGGATRPVPPAAERSTPAGR
jgi:hypothetical protein